MFGDQEPRFRSVPAASGSLGQEAVDFAAKAGLFLDPWQADVLRGSLGFGSGGRWAARNVAVLVPRQNGKGSILEARELFGLFALNEGLIIHSAHKFDTSQEHFLRMQALIEGNPDLDRHVAAMPKATGKESIVLRNGSRLKFKARTISGGGRGFSSDLLILDEAMYLPEESIAAMGPTMGARPNPQTWFTSSAGLPDSSVLWRQVQRGRQADPRMAYWEWGCPSDVDPADRGQWAAANPALGYRLSLEELEEDFRNLLVEDFAREHLGMWDEAADTGAFPAGTWDQALSAMSRLPAEVSYAVEVAEDRSWACIAAAGPVAGGFHGEVGEYARGTGWLVDRLADLTARHRPSRVVIQPSSPAGSLLTELRDRQVPLLEVTTGEYAQACGGLFDLVAEGQFRHLGQPALDVSVRSARKKPLSDAWVWNRRTPAVDISPLVAVTLAVWGATRPPARPGRFMSF